MSKWREWHPDPHPLWAMKDASKPAVFPRPEIKWGGMRRRCPVCHMGMPHGLCTFMGYTMHFATAHIGIPVFGKSTEAQNARLDKVLAEGWEAVVNG
jgi:hypothetical protein